MNYPMYDEKKKVDLLFKMLNNYEGDVYAHRFYKPITTIIATITNKWIHRTNAQYYYTGGSSGHRNLVYLSQCSGIRGKLNYNDMYVHITCPYCQLGERSPSRRFK